MRWERENNGCKNKEERKNNEINRYGNENMDLAVRAEDISTHRINKNQEQPPDASAETVLSVDAYAGLICMHACT